MKFRILSPSHRPVVSSCHRRNSFGRLCSLLAVSVWISNTAMAFSSPAYAKDLAKATERGFFTLQPAGSWEEALISGNGRHGALVYGQPVDETIVINHARLYMPLHEPLLPPDTASQLAGIRELLAKGEYQRAADLVVEISKREGFGDKRWTDPFIPAFDLKVEMKSGGECRDYSRSVDFQTGVASVHWESTNGAFERRLFVSRTEDVVALSIKGPGKGQVTCNLALTQRPIEGQGGWWPDWQFTNGIKEVAISAEPSWLVYRSQFKRSWPGSLQGYEGVARVINRGGSLTREGSKIRVTKADEVLVLLRVAVLPDYSASQVPALKRELRALNANFDWLLARHAKVHGEMFNRARLDLGGGADRKLALEQLIGRSHVGATSPALLEKEFDAARYAVLSSSGELFPNLQGIWNGTWGPPWSADFTQNGNVQSAIAANLSANFAEGMEPYFRYLESQVLQYRENARRLYGCRGIHVASRTSTHGLNNHFDSTWPMTFWTAGAGWAAHFFYDYYLYTGDREFLRQRALPFMKEAALFYQDFLIPGPDGRWLFSPSYSPENNPGNSPSQACINATMDVSVAKELLRNCIAACRTLGCDADKIQQWESMLAKMPDYQINGDGALKEWTTPLLDDNYAHRHCSHLYALFDGLPQEIATNQPLRDSFKVAVDKRVAFRRTNANGEMAFGAVQIGLAAASLGEAETSGEVVDWLANLYWTPALTSTHNAHSLFNTDICGGLPAVIIKMLVASDPGLLQLLPALPAKWPKGRIEGVKTRGQVTLRHLEWDEQRISVALRSEVPQTLKIVSPGGLRDARVVKGRAGLKETNGGEVEVTVAAGKDFVLEIQRGSRWTARQAWDWYKKRRWIVGFNYVPSTAANTTEFWAAESFDERTIDRELGWAEILGFDTCRVFVQYLVWQNDPAGLKRRMERFLSVADRHKLSTTFVLFDDCAFGDPPQTEPYLGKQRDPIPGMILPSWTPSPGLHAVTNRADWHRLEAYIKDVVGAFAHDRRVLLWDLYNEPGNSGLGNLSLPLVEATFAWARTANPTQPLTMSLWGAPAEISQRQLQLSDVVSFHFYGNYEGLRSQIGTYKQFGRPVISTEWMARRQGSRWDTDLPLFKKEGVGCYSWGLVKGRTQCQFAWYDRRGTPEPQIWFHDLFHADGTPYDADEHAVIRQTTSNKKLKLASAKSRDLRSSSQQPSRKEDGMQFSEGWTVWTGEGPEKNRLFYAREGGRQVRFIGNGSAITLVHKVGPDCGIARVLVNGKPVPNSELDTYKETVEWNHRTLINNNLGGSKNTVAVETTGRSNPRSSNSYVQVVGFETSDPKP
jgi:alpha-L-fucosidase 2